MIPRRNNGIKEWISNCYGSNFMMINLNTSKSTPTLEMFLLIFALDIMNSNQCPHTFFIALVLMVMRWLAF